MVDNSSLVIGTHWLESLLKCSNNGYYIHATWQIDDKGHCMSNHRIVSPNQDQSKLASLAFSEAAKLVTGEKSEYGFFKDNIGFVTVGWQEPIFNYVTSVIGHWAVSHIPCEIGGYTQMFSSYPAFRHHIMTYHGVQQGYRKKSYYYLAGTHKIEVRFCAGYEDIQTWNFKGPGARNLQLFLLQNTKEKSQVERNADGLLVILGKSEQLKITFLD